MNKRILLLDPGEITRETLMAELRQRGFAVTGCESLNEALGSPAPHVLVVNTFYGLEPVTTLVTQPGWEQTLVCGLSYSEFAARQFCDQGLTIVCHQLPLHAEATIALIAQMALQQEDILTCTCVRARLLASWREETTTLHRQIEADDQPFLHLGQQATYEETAHRLSQLAPITSESVKILVQLLQAEGKQADLEQDHLSAQLGGVPTIGLLRLQGKCEAYRTILTDLHAFTEARVVSLQ